MNKLIPFIQNLRIPCIVTGVGVRLSYEPDFSCSNSFDEQVKTFCKLILEKSASIGVRGEITARYLSKLGFKEHIRIIGCPSFYSNSIIKLKEPKELNYNSKVSFNIAKGYQSNVYNFIKRSQRYFKEYYIVPQGSYDLKLLYAGVPSPTTSVDYPCNSLHPWIQEDRTRFFINAPSWIKFFSEIDFSIGIKIHGTAAAILGGTPAFLFAIDSRTRELAEYHHIPFMNAKSVDAETNIYNIYENTDFSYIEKGHSERLNNFVDFLNENGLENIYSQKSDSILAQKINALNIYPAVRSILHETSTEKAVRLNLYMGHLNRKIAALQKQ